jgi:hypothetical protein
VIFIKETRFLGLGENAIASPYLEIAPPKSEKPDGIASLTALIGFQKPRRKPKISVKQQSLSKKTDFLGSADFI